MMQSDEPVLYDSSHPLFSDPHFNRSLLISLFSSDDAARIVQSERCTSDEIEQRIQCFSELPEEHYAVPRGNTVDMRCTVLNQFGKVQWSAKKILLGRDSVGIA
ncbi:unnamed protein product [Protopolystoma xenopodis]|uniref:Uncharacterized protein n=1 Tax=Protopolystoma xenopodis TaxID=117903 RepID=A0A448XG46_9PLAT|nr:unnamed protein product [Protopolystoma xenopodis]